MMTDPIVYDFDTDDEGWTTIGNGPSTYYSTGGNSGGYFGGMDGGTGVWYYRAPVTMLGNRNDFFGGTLSFDLIQADTTSPYVDDDVILGGGGITIVATLPSPPGLTWTSYSIDIEVGTFRIGSASGRIATEAEIRTVLANLDRLDIRGEYRSGADSSGLDHVILAEGPVNAPAVGQTAVTSTFDSSTQGWAFREDVAQFRHVTMGGNPGGFLEVIDAATGLVWYYVAPDAYLEDKSPFYGGLVSFDLRQSLTDSQFDSEDVILRSGSTVLVLDTAANPGTGWTHYEIALDTSAAWRVGNLSGSLATEQEIRDVLSNLTSFEIRGEYRTGADTGSMDNVIMQTPVGVIAGTSGDDVLTGTSAVESIYGLDGNDTLKGDTGNDFIYGNAGNDVLDGGIGSDTMTGGTGNDVYYVDSADVVTELAGEGTDEVRTTRAGYVLDANVENLTGLVATGQALVGNGLANVIIGGAGNDQLDGKAGADTLFGGAGNDTYYIDDAGDVVSEMG